jgi:hypothetical protein
MEVVGGINLPLVEGEAVLLVVPALLLRVAPED